MIVAVYLSLYTLIAMGLSMQVIKNRLKYRVSVGDGDVEELQIAMGAQSNAVEYLTIGSVLLIVLELSGGSVWLLHGLGVALFVGRLFHMKGMFAKRLAYRVTGMRITIFSLIALALFNLLYVPFGKLV